MRTIDIRLPAPHSAKQRQIIMSLSTPGLLETWVACGTKFGKTLSAAEAIALRMPTRPQKISRWIAPTLMLARLGQRYLKRMLPPEPYTHLNQYGLHIVPIDSTLEFRTGKDPESLEGEASDANVLDEASKLKANVYPSVKTTVSVTKGPMLITSTPRGKGWFYSKCMEAKAEMEWALANGKQPARIFLSAPTSENPFVPREMIDDARKALPDRLFRQYYLAEFVDDGSVFIGVRDHLNSEPLSFGYHERNRWATFNAEEADVVVGVDWGRQDDYTVFIAINTATRAVVGFERFRKVAYTNAVRMLISFTRLFKSVAVVWHDKTGVGTALDDLMACTNLNYRGINFTNASKSEMVAHLITAFEHGSLSVPDWDILIGELDAYEVRTSDLGMAYYSAPQGKHDDTVAALMLANAALSQYSAVEASVRFLEELPSAEIPKSAMQTYFDQMADDDD